MDLHANVRLWQREEDGSYKAEIEGCMLHVTWRPERQGERRGFVWKIEGPNGLSIEAEGPEEEIEIAMATAEREARLGAR